MELKSLEDKKVAIEAAFESIQSEQKTHNDKVIDLNVELLQLQGEYRLIEQLIANYKVKGK